MLQALKIALSAAVVVPLAVAAVQSARPTVVEPDDASFRNTGIRTWFPVDDLPRLALVEDQTLPVSSMLNVPHRMRFGEYVWNDVDIPAGVVTIRIDPARQLLSVFRDGHEIGSSVILYGTDNKPTPSGRFRIMQKAAKHRSNLYDADMPFMLRLTADGVAIHASHVRQGSATHGCIGVPLNFARRLFAEVALNDSVTILPSI